MILLALVAVLGIAACKGAREKKKMPSADIAKNVSAFATLPSCLEMYRVLDTKESVNYAGILPTSFIDTGSDTTLVAAWIGTLFADGILTAKAGHNPKLTEFQSTLSKAPIPDENLKNAVAELADFIKERDTQITLKAVVHLMDMFESYWWQKGDFASYTMLVASAWAATAYRLSGLAKASYPSQAMGILGHRQAWASLNANLTLLKAAPVAGTGIYQAATRLCSEMLNLLPDAAQNNLDAASLDRITAATGSFLSSLGYKVPGK